MSSSVNKMDYDYIRAQQLVRTGRVKRIYLFGRPTPFFIVIGEHGTYVSVMGETCTCPAFLFNKHCYHIVAVNLALKEHSYDVYDVSSASEITSIILDTLSLYLNKHRRV